MTQTQVTAANIAQLRAEDKSTVNNTLLNGILLKGAKSGQAFGAPNQIATETPPTKPRSWFEDHPNKKPEVIIPKCSLELNALAPMVKKAIATFKLQGDMALVFLSKYFNEQIKSDPLTDDWKSYGITICARGQVATPMSICTVIDGQESDFSTLSQEILADGDLPAMVLYILAIYRIQRLVHQSHITIVSNRIKDMLKGFRKDTIVQDTYLDNIQTSYKGWMSNSNFLKLVASFDMFMFKFKNHSLASMRVATVSSRFRDCAGLTSIQQVAKTMGREICAEVGYWCFTPQLGKEFMNLFTGHEELSIQDSYFPYQIDLGLTDKSAYSATVNQTLYFFLHSVAALIGSKRSNNAIHNLDSDPDKTTRLAIWVALIHHTSSDFSREIIDYSETIPNQDDPVDEDDFAPDTARPRDANPRTWYAYLKDRNFDFTPNDILQFAAMRNNLGRDLRENTIGHYLSTYQITPASDRS
ncbi:nucleocapsid protein [Drosophila affinis sigmavirus]|uniref:Nucleoprotein n=1 Tax=Drosophila affinis sigmavirus TaxID=1308859 RepID=A0A140D8J9_9RHAB|nr:nucleocapsid protein [Drosophila affinis sigmavirus]AMK09223.1 nucleocapsid protein [Drosophila affinis sigmavirus]